MKTILEYVSALASREERQGDALRSVDEFIGSVLEEYRIPHKREEFVAEIPESEAFLEIDGIPVPCLGCGLVGGEIPHDAPVIESPTSADILIETPSIAFNPSCEAISRAEFFFAPVVAIARGDAERVRNAKERKGRLIVKKKNYACAHILAGNTDDPRSVVFAHFDSISRGAFDNASGVAVALHAILSRPELLKTTLFVFDPNEELSFEKPTYWGKGFRVFEERHAGILEGADVIVPLDGVGNGPARKNTDPGILHLAFPLAHMEKFIAKIVTIHGDTETLPAIYHSSLDVPENLSEKYLLDAEETLLDMIGRF